MGGSLLGGNVTPYAEFNFYADPDAAAQVLSSGVPIRLIGLDVTHQAYLTDEEIEAFGNIQSKRAGMVCDLMKQYGKYYKDLGFPGTPIHDAAAMIYEAFGNQVFTKEEAICLEVVTSGDEMGECIKREGEPNVSYVTEVDREAFVRVLKDCCME